MEYQAIKDILVTHFKSRLESLKANIAKDGMLTKEHRALLSNGNHIATDALQLEDYTILGTDEQLTRFIDLHSLPIKPSDKTFNVLRIEFLKAYRDYCASAISANAAMEHYDFNSDRTIASPKNTIPPRNRRKLVEAIHEQGY